MPTQDVLLAWHRLRNALGAAGMGTWHVDLSTGVATHDENLNRILGLQPVETQGPLRDPYFTRIHAVDHERALSAERAQLIRDLEQASRVKDEFLAMLSHELRTPLNAVLGWTRMLRRGTVPPERTASILDTIERNAAAQMQIIEELLDLSSMTAGNL